METKRVEMFGLLFNACTLEQATQMVVFAAENHRKGLVVTPNVDHVVKMDGDSEMKAIYQGAMFCFSDGMPLVWFSKLLGCFSLPSRVTGADLLPSIAILAAEKGLKLFFMGGEEGVAALAASKLLVMCPKLQIAGVYCPPFGFEDSFEESQKIISMINASHVDILFVGVGAPKQEKWVARWLDQLQVGPVLGVGAAFDFAAGTVRRAPVFFQRAGLEWFWRLMQEPGRMWKRYVIQDSRFILLAFHEWWNS